MFDTPVLAYVASIIDTQGIIRIRTAGDTELPMVALHGSNTQMLEYLAALTGTRVTIVRREYSKVGCTEHCMEKHQHITSKSGRWSVTGFKATVLLYNIQPYIRFQRGPVRAALVVGMGAPIKPATVGKMAKLGWEIPSEFEDRRSA